MSASAYDTVVIGGGVSGLVCALLQARKGCRVFLVEKAKHLSPTLWGFERRGTYFDTGFHYAGSIGADGLLSFLLRRLDLDQTLGPDMDVTEVYDRVRFQASGREIHFPQGWDALEASLAAAFPQETVAITKFLHLVRSQWEEGRAAFKVDLGQSLGPLFAKEGPSLGATLNEMIQDPTLRAVLSCHGILYGSSARATSLMFHSQVVGSYYESACFYRGGGRRWVEVFAQALQQAGVTVRCGQGVQRIELDEQKRFHAVVLADGQRVVAQHCIATVHPKTLLDLIPEQAFRPVYQRRIDNLQESSSAVVLFGRISTSPFTGNLILIDDPSSVWDWQECSWTQRPLFVSVCQRSGAVSIICPATLDDVPDGRSDERSGRPPTYKQWKQDVVNSLLERVARYAADILPDFELLESASPLTFRDWVGSPEGGIYGVQHRQEDLPLLPQTRVPGLYLSGQAIVAPGVLGALCAGFLTESCVA